MKTAYFDCIFGVSGDMILGSLVANGVPVEHLREELGKLGVEGFALDAEAVVSSSISGSHVIVETAHQHVHRHLSHIRDIINSSTVADRVKERAIAIFTRLAEAEARVHGTTPEKIHFHEVGALDAIVDVVGACIGLEYLGVGKVISSPIRLGTGTVKCAHGVMPVPVPAVTELTKDVPVVRTDIVGEITTPTGAAIITTLASSYGWLEHFTAGSVGYGVGTKTWDDHPNVLRLTVGQVPGDLDTDQCLLVETNIDNMNPEIYGYLMDRMFEAGAKDVTLIPVFMKKGRPATLLSILADDATVHGLVDLVLTETTTLGVRITRVVRKKLRRESRTIDTEFGPVRIKTAIMNGNERHAPEYDDCSRIAREQRIPLVEVYRRIGIGIGIGAGGT